MSTKTRAALAPVEPALPINPGDLLSPRLWRISAAAIVAVAALLRFLWPTLAPLHNDEGVNGDFLSNLIHLGQYRYDPANYHGPSLYYITALFARLAHLLHLWPPDGLSTALIRLVPAAFGLAIVLLMLRLARHLDPLSALVAATLTACSPAAVYYSRYFIHESLFVFFGLASIVLILEHRAAPRLWKFWLASATLALMVATKETWLVDLITALIAWGCTWLFSTDKASSPDERGDRPSRRASSFRHAPWLRALGAIVIFATIHVLLYSSLLHNFPQGVYDSVLTFKRWASTGTHADVHPWSSYIRWLSGQETCIFLLGLLGLVAAAEIRRRVPLFFAFLSIGMLAAYSLIPYKTPWLILNITVPWAITAGYGVAWSLPRLLGSGNRRAVVAFLAAAFLLQAGDLYSSVRLSFFEYDNDAIPYVYAHTVRQVYGLLDLIRLESNANPARQKTSIAILAPDYWPLPWYLRKYPNAGYWGRLLATNDDLVIGEETQQPMLANVLGTRYRLVGRFPLRPGVVLLLYLKNKPQ